MFELDFTDVSVAIPIKHSARTQKTCLFELETNANEPMNEQTAWKTEVEFHSVRDNGPIKGLIGLV